MIRTLTAACTLLAALALGGCESASDPEGPEGGYTLYHVHGGPPPANIGFGEELLGSRLILDESGQAAITLEIRRPGPEGGAMVVVHDTVSGQWSAEGSRLNLAFAQGEGYTASAAIVSPREVAVSLRHSRSTSNGFFTVSYPLLYRR